MIFTAIRPEVQEFARDMELKLLANDHKRNWSTVRNATLLRYLRKEVEELAKELKEPSMNPKAIIKEAADIANFAMMIADNTRTKGVNV